MAVTRQIRIQITHFWREIELQGLEKALEPVPDPQTHEKIWKMLVLAPWGLVTLVGSAGSAGIDNEGHWSCKRRVTTKFVQNWSILTRNHKNLGLIQKSKVPKWVCRSPLAVVEAAPSLFAIFGPARGQIYYGKHARTYWKIDCVLPFGTFYIRSYRKWDLRSEIGGSGSETKIVYTSEAETLKWPN